jgi:hypothetical protein
MVAGWTNIVLGLLFGFATTIGFLSGNISGAESPFFILVACLLVAVGAFALALRPWPTTIFGLSLLFLGLFLGFGLLVGGSVFGAAEAAVTKVVGVAGILLAALEAWSILAVSRHRRRPVRGIEPPDAEEEGEPSGAGGEIQGPDPQNGVGLSGLHRDSGSQ